MKQKSAEVPILEYIHAPCADSEGRLSRALDLIVDLILADPQEQSLQPPKCEAAERVP